MQYIAFMHNNADTRPSQEEWAQFFDRARESGLFRGGSAMGNRTTIGVKSVPDVSEHVEGYMLFETQTHDELLALLQRHPIAEHGGTVEICELPRSRP